MDERPSALQRVPTLTEVVSDLAGADGSATAAAPASAEPGGLDAQAIVQSVLADLQPRVDLMFEYRVREALEPLLREAADQIAQRARIDLAQALRDVVARAVAEELARRSEPTQRGPESGA